jgi:predicted nucleic acid-binding protein
MPETLYDTRFLIEAYFTKDLKVKKRLKTELEERKIRFVSAITIYEVYRLSLKNEGRTVAKIRRATIERDFRIIDIDSSIASQAAEIKAAQGRDYPLADALIAATAVLLKLTCFTDDPHIKQVPDVKTRWVF